MKLHRFRVTLLLRKLGEEKTAADISAASPVDAIRFGIERAVRDGFTVLSLVDVTSESFYGDPRAA